jgi:hypothetical protein
MIGMNVAIGQCGNCVGMLWLWNLIFGAFASPLMGLGAFVFDPDLDTFWERLSRATAAPRANDRLANLKEYEAIPPFPIGDECQVVGLLHHVRERLDRLPKKGPIVFATTQVLDKATGAIHENDGPARRISRGLIRIDFRVEFVAFNHLVQKLMAHSV